MNNGLKTIEDSEKFFSLDKLSNDNKISFSEDGVNKLWDIKSGDCLKTYNCRWGLVFFFIYIFLNHLNN